MPAPAIRADYDQLSQAAAVFGSQAQAARALLQAVQRQVDVLQAGDWMGQGAAAFYQEMSSLVLPALRRLASALESAQATTAQINATMAQAEAEAARHLRANGSGQALAGAGAAAFSGGPGSAAAAGPVPAGPAPGGGGAGAPATARPPFTVQDAAARIIAEENAAVERKMGAFSPAVRELVKQSPTLRMQVAQMEKLNFNFTLATSARGGYFTDRGNHQVQIDASGSPLDTVAQIAHELGHVVNEPKTIDLYYGMQRDEYVPVNVQAELMNEAQAQFNVGVARAELQAQGFPPLTMPGAQSADFQRTYDDFAAGRIDHGTALSRMATMMGNERRSVPPKVTYRQFYTEFYDFIYDTSIDVPRRPPVGTRR
jgi:WXG100 family type VII secretion target